MNPPCQFLEWDSAFFGYRIARVNGSRLTPESMGAIEAWCAERRIDCLYFLSASDDLTTTSLAERHHFHMVDIRVTLSASLKPETHEQKTYQGIRLNEPDDLPALKRIARESFVHTRFYNDLNFPRERCAEMYEVWIEKSGADSGQAVLVATADGAPAGFVTCSRAADGIGQIGLFGVDSAYRGRGLGHQLIEAALAWFARHDFQNVVVVTQGRNLSAQRSYQRQGFVTQSLEVWYHRWFTKPTHPV